MKSLRFPRQRLGHPRRIPCVERLEARCLLAADMLEGTPAEQVDSAVDSLLSGSLEFQKMRPLGSLVARVEGNLTPLSGGGDSERLKFFAEAGSTVAFRLTPAHPGARLRVRVADEQGMDIYPQVWGSIGQPVNFPLTRILADGEYTLTVTAATSPGTDVYLVGVRNAVLESQSRDSTEFDQVDLNASFVGLGGGGINAVVGSTETIYEINSYNQPEKFVDIAGTGTPLNLRGSDYALINSGIRNEFFSSGQFLIGNSGGVLDASVFDDRYPDPLPHSNQPLSTVNGQAGLYAFWDAIGATSGNVYWQERKVGGIDALIVQWDQQPLFNANGDVTFQIQVFREGPVLARFAYRDVEFGDALHDFGASATIGAVSQSLQVLEFSHDQPTLSNGDAIDFVRAEIDIDHYTFFSRAGNTVDVIFERLNARDSSTRIILIDPNGNVIAEGTSTPLANRTSVRNYDQGILGVTLPLTGRYSVQLHAADQFDYTLVVTEQVVFDTENTIDTIAPMRTLELPSATVGFLNGGDPRDVVQFDVSAGETIRILTSTPFDHIDNSPRNSLQMSTTLIAPDRSIVATTRALDDNGNLILKHVATQSGNYRLNINREGGSGEYYSRVFLFRSLAAPLVDGIAGMPSVTSITNLAHTSEWTTTDVNRDGIVSALDCLLIVNHINLQNSSTEFLPSNRNDVNQDGIVSSLDVLLVINELNSQALKLMVPPLEDS
ncbi:MAG: dockerin type I domain-containing protein [Pirellulaceae bacterium]